MKNKSEFKLLVVDDDAAVIDALDLLFDNQYTLVKAFSGQEAIKYVESMPDIGVAVVDIKMPGMDGIEASRRIKELNPDLPIIFHTGFPGLYSEDDIDVHEKPFEYVQKGSSISKLKRAVRNAFEVYSHRQGVPVETVDPEQQYGMIGKSRAMQKIFRMINKVAESDVKVMILGETGTGKELVARAIHRLSERSDKRLVIFNCNHKAPDLVESELFGHGKGAFTGAVEDRVGLFEYANSGTVFLDEIGDLDITTQAKILRVLETGEFQTVGKTAELKKTDIRLLCATHHDLKKMVEQKKFREDLYYRLKGVEIIMPPLRERKQDIPLFVTWYVDKLTVQNNCQPKYFDPSAMEALLQYDWPGNVRELLDTLESVVVLSDSDLIMASDVNRIINSETKVTSLQNSLSERTIEFRKNCIITALHESENNINAAARSLQIDPANLRKLIKNYRIQ